MTHRYTCPRYWYGEPDLPAPLQACGCLNINLGGYDVPVIRVEIPEDTDDRP